jgi:hypothetical protein
MRQILLEAGWPIYPVIALGALTLVSSLRRDRLAMVIGFGVATILMGILGTALGLQVSARASAEAPPELRHLALQGFYEATHNLDVALVFAIVSTLVTTMGHRRKLSASPAGPVVAPASP